jgi:hypothetical protein
MREQILNYLNRAGELYNEINLLYSGKLPQNILDGSKHTVEMDIPRHLNNFITIINMVEQAQIYPKINTIQEGIDLFNNPQLDKSIQNAIDSANVVGIGGNQTDMPAKEILAYSQDAIRSGVELLHLQISAAKIIR